MKVAFVAFLSFAASPISDAFDLASSSLNVAEHRAPAWISNALRVDAGKRVIYYLGTVATEVVAATGPAKLIFMGDVLVLDEGGFILASHVACAKDGTGKIAIKGKNKSVVIDENDFAVREPIQALVERK